MEIKPSDIFKCAALVKNQEEADKAKQICIDNDLSIWERSDAFDVINDNDDEWYVFSDDNNDFYVDCIDPHGDLYGKFDVISLEEFEELAKSSKIDEYESVEDILYFLKETIKNI
jgi:hypothetical protein